jgi:CBS domain-containing protein
MKLEDVMSDPIFIDKSESLSYALDVMEKEDTRRLLVVRDGVVEGVLTLRNIMRELGSRKHGSLSASSLRVATAVSPSVELRDPETELKDVLGRFDEISIIIVGSSMEKEDIDGWIRPVDVIPHLSIESYAGNIMKPNPLTFSPHERIAHARRLMLERDVGRAPVVEDERLVGIITEREIARAERDIREDLTGSQQETRFRTMIVEDVMTVNPKFVYTNDGAERVLELMTKGGVGGLPVLNLEERVVGMIARRDVIRAALND